MNPSDLDPTLAQQAMASALLQATREIADGPLRRQVCEIDKGLYPAEILSALARAGAMSAHLQAPDGPGDVGLSIQVMAEVSRVCGATGFMMWCQAVCGLYCQESSSEFLRGPQVQWLLEGGLGGTAMSNPMKRYAQIEDLLLHAKRVEGGYRVSGALPWVSNLGADHVCGALAQIQGEDAELMFLMRCNAEGLTLRDCPSFSGMEGTGTYALHLKDVFVPAQDCIADPARPLIRRIRPTFVLLQTGMALGVIRGAIDSIWAVEEQLGHVNAFLEDRPEALEQEAAALEARILELARRVRDPSDEVFLQVLDVRAHGSELALRAAQSALLHQGARGYLLSSDVQRRIRESHFVAIVTPAIKHLRKEMARIQTEVQPA